MFEKAKWIWNQEAMETDSYVEFLTECEADSNDTVLLRVSSSSNYAVYVNGIFVDSGQYADFPHYKIYDQLDLSSHMVKGKNHIAFIVWYYGIPSFTSAGNSPGLLFELEKNKKIINYSDEFILCRKSKQYLSGRNETITYQQGLNFNVDLRKKDDWMLGVESSKFEKSIILKDMPKQLYPREIKKLIVKPRIEMMLKSQGTFSYLSEEGNAGTKMQHAAMSFCWLHEMGEEKNGMIILETKTEHGIWFIIDMQEESAGYLDFDLEVLENCEMEVGWGEHLEDLRCRTQIGPRNFGVTIVLKKGRNQYMNPFRRFGCRYLQFFVHTNLIKVHYAGIRPTVYPVKLKKYKSGNLLRDCIYKVSQHTLLQCMHEHYEDCPWREQAFYTLDSRNQMLCGYHTFEEFQFPRAGLRLISKAIREDGMLPICFPSTMRESIPSFSLFYIIQLGEYYQYTKDKETIEFCFGCAKEIFKTFIGKMDQKGLVPNFDEKQDFWNFYEWQPYMEGYTYHGKVHDMCLNALFSWSIDYYIELCKVMDIDTEEILELKNNLNKKIVETFYDEERKLFFICDKPELKKFSVLANAWGCLCGAANTLDQTVMLDTILNNSYRNSEIEVIPATLSMHTFRYEVLLKANKERYKNDILREIDETYFRMLQKGATSFWETELGESDFDYAGSLCHGWSAMPVYYYELLDEDYSTDCK